MKCKTGKRRYRDEIAAKLALAKTSRRDSGERRYYFCTFCKSFHLTSQEQRTEMAPR